MSRALLLIAALILTVIAFLHGIAVTKVSAAVAHTTVAMPVTVIWVAASWLLFAIALLWAWAGWRVDLRDAVRVTALGPLGFGVGTLAWLGTFFLPAALLIVAGLLALGGTRRT